MYKIVSRETIVQQDVENYRGKKKPNGLSGNVDGLQNIIIGHGDPSIAAEAPDKYKNDRTHL